MFVFLHIPKTAGTTLRELLIERLQPVAPLRIEDVSRIAYRTDAWLNSHDFISGHFGASLLRRLDPSATTFTMLREPVARVKSQFKYLCKLAAMDVQFNGYQALLRGRTLRELLADTSDPVINSLFRDTQTWALVSDYQHHYRHFDLTPGEVLAQAQNTLSSLTCFGIVEDVSTTLRILTARLGQAIDLPGSDHVHANESSASAAEPEDAQLDDFIREHTPLDVALYEWAARAFRDQASATGATTATVAATDRPSAACDGLAISGECEVREAQRRNSELVRMNAALRAWADRVECHPQSPRTARRLTWNNGWKLIERLTARVWSRD
jgi:hypothetical protein